MLSGNGISLVDAIIRRHSDGIHLLALGVGDSVAGVANFNSSPMYIC